MSSMCLFLLIAFYLGYIQATTVNTCNVVVVGGSLGGVSSALHSAREGIVTCLLEPTDWLGGQSTLTVPAADYAWHKTSYNYDVGTIAKNPLNQGAEWYSWMLPLYNTVTCWVSFYCYTPATTLLLNLQNAVANETLLSVYYQTVPKSVTMNVDGTKINTISAIQRTALDTTSTYPGYMSRLSQVIADWYSPTNSVAYSKQSLTFAATNMIVIDATETGELLGLMSSINPSMYTYAQGVETTENNPSTNNDQCGQSMTYPFSMWLPSTNPNVPLNTLTVPHPTYYSMGTNSWQDIWRYRRIVGTTGTTATAPATGEITVQNWQTGNDDPYVYHLLSKAATQGQGGNWQGGVNVAALDDAERHAIGWFYNYRTLKTFTHSTWLDYDRPIFKTGHGLSKVPYTRDSRRSIGLNGFTLQSSDLVGATQSSLTGTVFSDRIGIGAYAFDIHQLNTCTYPSYMTSMPSTNSIPYFIPFRSLTHQNVSNFLVGSKNLAQSFLASAATRVHIVEWNVGVGCGVSAAYMFKNGLSSINAYNQISLIQQRIRVYTPLEWTINGVSVPSLPTNPEIISGIPTGTGSSSLLPDFPVNSWCRLGTSYDTFTASCMTTGAYGNTPNMVIGPFPDSMVTLCQTTSPANNDPKCTSGTSFTTEFGTTISVIQWPISWVTAYRDRKQCPVGTTLGSLSLTDGYCYDSAHSQVYGPFSAYHVNLCKTLNSADSDTTCSNMKWSLPYTQNILNSLSSNTPSQTELRGTWLTNVDSDVLFSLSAIQTAVSNMVNMNINTVYVTVWNGGYTLYPSQVSLQYTGQLIFPDVRLTGRDPLKELIIAAHQVGIRVYAWLEFGFAIPATSQIVTQHPTWVTSKADGTKLYAVWGTDNIYWLNPLHPDVQQMLLNLMEEILQTYNVDGFQLDDHISWPVEFGYDVYTHQKYTQSQNVQNLPVYTDATFKSWRANVITQFIYRAWTLAKYLQPNVIYSISPNPYPWCYDNQLVNWPTWEQTGYVDELVVQLYDRSNLPADLSQSNLVTAAGHIPVAIGLLSGLKNSGRSMSQITTWVNQVTTTPPTYIGIVFFFYQSLIDWDPQGLTETQRMSQFRLTIFPDVKMSNYPLHINPAPHATHTVGTSFVVDNTDASFGVVTGSWTVGANPGYYGTNYFVTTGATSGKSMAYYTYLTGRGIYKIYMSRISTSTRANNVPVQICTDSVTCNSITVDETVTLAAPSPPDASPNTHSWNLIGASSGYCFTTDTAAKVIVKNDGVSSSLYVEVDAIYFLYVTSC
jgi:uncharacterized lipoprotein YddW (UPF0748 family)